MAGRSLLGAASLLTQGRPTSRRSAAASRWHSTCFRVVDSCDPEVRRTSLVPRPNVVIEKTEQASVDVRKKDQTERPKDIYAELVKLQDLRKRGILTETEFDAQKRKLLSSS
jgi:hypothetical protein